MLLLLASRLCVILSRLNSNATKPEIQIAGGGEGIKPNDCFFNDIKQSAGVFSHPSIISPPTKEVHIKMSSAKNPLVNGFCFCCIFNYCLNLLMQLKHSANVAADRQ